jgi:uncharacterized protein with GYD domain
MLFMLSLNFTDQGIRSIKDTSKRINVARDLAKKLGAEMKQLYLTTGEHDLVVFVEAPSGDHIAKFALAVGSLGNIRSGTSRLWTEEEYVKMVSELP